MQQGVSANADALGAPLLRRLDERAAFTKRPGQLTRRSLTPAHPAASQRSAAWRQEAGRRVRTDARLSVVGRDDGRRPQAPAILLALPLDTGLDAGRCDGVLAVPATLAAVAEPSRQGDRRQQPNAVAADASITAKDAGLGLKATRRLEHRRAGPGLV